MWGECGGSDTLLSFSSASLSCNAQHRQERERHRETEREWMRNRERKTERSGLGHYHSYYSSLKYTRHKDMPLIFMRLCVCVCVCVTHTHAHMHTSAWLLYAHKPVRTQEKWQKENNIIGEMYAVIIGIQKMIIHIKQGAQSQPHLHVLDYMHFKSNFRGAYEWH